MKRRMLAALTALALLLPCLSASAAPVVQYQGSTAWLGADNHMFLLDAAGVLKELPSAIADIIGIDGTYIYCTTAGGRLYAVRTDGSASSLVDAAPTEETPQARRPVSAFTLADGLLSRVVPEGNAVPLSADVVCYAESEDALWFVRADVNGVYTLNTLALTADPNALAPIIRVAAQVQKPLSVTLTPAAVTLVTEDHAVQVVDLQTETLTDFPAASDRTEAAAVMNGRLIRYAAEGQGWRVESSEAHTARARNAADAAPSPAAPTPFTITPAPTGAAPLTPVPAATPFMITPAPVRYTPAATPRPTARPTATPAEDNTIRKWDTGSEVRKMQKRLQELGYPVGRVDGSYGEQTDIAVRLFQSAAGLAEHTYLTKKGQNRLYAGNAPVYDAFIDLKKGDRGIRVRLMQERLQLLGYNPGKIDGIYGENTVRAVAAYQQAIGMQLEPNELPGEKASRWLLMNLYGEIIPAPPAPTPTALPDPTPTALPDPTPAGDPDPTPTALPDPTPAGDPDPTPTALPDPTPAGDPDPTPAVDPDPTPTVLPDPTPASVPDPTPASVPDPTPASVPDPTPASVPDPTPTGDPDPTPAGEEP